MGSRIVQTHDTADSIRPPAFDFSKRPFLVIWETTKACGLACVHCRAEADPNPDPHELTHDEALELIRDVKEMGTPILVFSGGDPLRRKDLPELIRYAHSLKLRTGAIPAVTPDLTREKIVELQESGLSQIAFSLDAASAEEHDAFRRTAGVFDRTLASINLANELGLHAQVNSLINVHNQESLDRLIQLIEKLNLAFWEVFFLVPIGRGKDLPLLQADKFEETFAKLYALNKRVPFVIKVTEAPHYRRFYIEQEMKSQGIDPRSLKETDLDLPAFLRRRSGPGGSIGHAPDGVNSGKGFIFVSRTGEVMPSGFLPITAGSVREKSLADIYQNASLLKELRDASLLKGRCGVCPYKNLCGGSRSRAFALTGDYLAEDPGCSYQPAEFCTGHSTI